MTHTKGDSTAAEHDGGDQAAFMASMAAVESPGTLHHEENFVSTAWFLRNTGLGRTPLGPWHSELGNNSRGGGHGFSRAASSQRQAALAAEDSSSEPQVEIFYYLLHTALRSGTNIIFQFELMWTVPEGSSETGSKT
jgi:hypothetical protein